MTARSGYAVTIRGFIPVDPSDLDSSASKKTANAAVQHDPL